MPSPDSDDLPDRVKVNKVTSKSHAAVQRLRPWASIVWRSCPCAESSATELRGFSVQTWRIQWSGAPAGWPGWILSGRQ